MKKIILFIAAVALAVSVFAQTSGEFFTFDAGGAPFTSIGPEGIASFTQTVAEGKLTIEVGKGAQNWGFLQLWTKAVPSGFKYDLTNSPVLKVNASVCSTCAEVTMTVRFKQIIAVGNEKQVETSKTVTAVSQELVFDFTDQIATSGIDLTQIQEIHVDLSNGWDVGYIGTVIFEDMTIGSVANNTPVIKSSELKVYPTMVNNTLTVENAKTIKVVNAIGNEVYSGSNLSAVQSIDLSNIPSGVYIVIANDKTFRIVKK